MDFVALKLKVWPKHVINLPITLTGNVNQSPVQTVLNSQLLIFLKSTLSVLPHNFDVNTEPQKVQGFLLELNLYSFKLANQKKISFLDSLEASSLAVLSKRISKKVSNTS